MFNDEEPLSFKKMHDFSTADGFLEITEDLADMIRGSWSPATWGQNSLFMQTDGEKRGSGYLSSIFRPTKQMIHSLESSQAEISVDLDPSTSILRGKEMEAEDLPSSSELQEESVPDEGSAHQRLLSLYEENYDEFKADREAKLEEWLGGMG
ncbi:Unknown protein [Striga hermonthica]|uniref:Uncharacterized protein n=1 Tax=Striga hermonthica TaxID=68872 RepID=A0A9N7P0T3_STRHE|nr:Unknown protein [Striga hermonthica]